MTTRRGFLSGLLATGLAPQASWADLGAPALLSAARAADGSYLLAGLSADGALRFTCPLPGRGHAAAAHPQRPEAVAFARRPGRFADVIDCRSGAYLTRLEPPAGHHFYGHGVFTPDGRQLFTTENDYETGRGVIGVWSAKGAYHRTSSFASGGIGPHDMLLRRHNNSTELVVANGGIATHPDSGRAKLNLAEMRPNLSVLSLSGDLRDRMELGPDLQLNSIRHLALAKDGTIGFAMQWQGDIGADVPIVGLYSSGTSPRLMAEEDPRLRNLQGYGGSVAFTPDGSRVAVTSPRGGVVQVMNCASTAMLHEHHLQDVCGLAPAATGLAPAAPGLPPAATGLLASTGTGLIFALNGTQLAALNQQDLAWDNHLIPLG